MAVSDPLGITAQGVETIRRKSENKLRQTLARIDELVKQYDVDRIVLGLPVHMSGEMGDRAVKTLAFRQMLEKRTGRAVVMWDERLTTVEAGRVLDEAEVAGRARKDVIDMLAAVLILQSYMDSPAGRERQD